MRNAQTENQPSTPVQSSSQARKHTIQITLLAAAAILLLLGPRCHALASSDNPNPSVAAQAANTSAVPAPNGATTPLTQQVRVVRLSDVEGTVQIVRDNRTEFSHAVMNMPLTQGTSIETGPDGRAEIEFEDGSVTRITPNSSLGLARLGMTPDGTLETTLEQPSGVVYYELRSDPRSAYTVTFGQAQVVPTVNSTFRMNLGSSPPELAVMDGQVRVNGASNSYLAEVPQGKTIDFQPSGSAQYTIADGIIPNGFDDWNDQMDAQAAKEAQNQTPARTQQGGGSIMDGMGFGWGDLDAYGGWYPLPGYGMVWQPFGIGPGFDPYGFGDWADIGGFGVSWVSGYPWGWLPFQCGGWSYIGSFGWGWMPGGCGFGIGFGYGGRYWHRHPGLGRGYTRIYSAPAGYHAPVPPANLRAGMRGSQAGENLVHVGHSGIAAGPAANREGSVNRARTIDFHGAKIAPLQSMRAGVDVPMRNAALFNNAPARAFQGGVHDGFLGRRSGELATQGVNGMRTGEFNRMRASNAANFEHRGAFEHNGSFGQHAMFGSHGSFHGTGAAFHSAAGFRGGSFGGAARGGGGFHGSGGFSGGGFHGGGGGFSGGGGHAGGGGGGGHH